MSEIPIGSDVVEAAAQGQVEAARKKIPSTPRWEDTPESVKVPVREEVEAAIREALDKLGLREEFGHSHEGHDTPHTTCDERALLEPLERRGEHVVTRLVSDWRSVDTEPAEGAQDTYTEQAQAVRCVGRWETTCGCPKCQEDPMWFLRPSATSEPTNRLEMAISEVMRRAPRGVIFTRTQAEWIVLGVIATSEPSERDA